MATRLLNESTGKKYGEFGAGQAQPRGSRRTERTRRVRGLLVAVTMASMLAPMTGCMFISGAQRMLTRHDGLDEFMVDYRNRAWAARAWLCRRDQFASHCYIADLEAGFRQGYEDVAAGGSGCLPAVCPRSYWGWQYQSADGQSRMNAWFEGYPLGVQAAEQDGVGNWGNVAAAFPSQQPAPVQPAAAVPAGEQAVDAAIRSDVLPPAPMIPSVTEAVTPLADPPEGIVLPPGLKQPVESVLPLSIPEL